jgi:hypothetical protein
MANEPGQPEAMRIQLTLLGGLVGYMVWATSLAEALRRVL